MLVGCDGILKQLTLQSQPAAARVTLATSNHTNDPLGAGQALGAAVPPVGAGGAQPLGEMLALIDWLQDHIPPGDEDPAASRLSHGDFRCRSSLGKLFVLAAFWTSQGGTLINTYISYAVGAHCSDIPHTTVNQHSGVLNTQGIKGSRDLWWMSCYCRLDNLVFDEHDSSKVLAVLDWELSTIGDPLATWPTPACATTCRQCVCCHRGAVPRVYMLAVLATD